jgi:hypothetical protein
MKLISSGTRGAKLEAVGDIEKNYGAAFMDNVFIPGSREDIWVTQRVLGNYDAPAFVRRAQRVDEALDYLLAHCRQLRDQWLTIPRLRLGLLCALAGEWEQVRPMLADDDQLDLLRELEMELSPRLRVRIEPTTSRPKLQRALRELQESLEIFNRRWQAFLPTVNLTPVNESREAYNRYYLLEKECALRSPRLARQGFRRLPSFAVNELTTLLPVLPIPKLKEMEI